MIGFLSRIILAFGCFPLLGAFSLRWVGGYAADVLGMVHEGGGAALPLDWVGTGLGVLLGLGLAIQVIGCCLQPESSPVRPVADGILIILAFTLLADVLIPRVIPQASFVSWLQPITLAIWGGCGAATMSLHRMRAELRAPLPRPAPPIDRQA